MFEELEHTADLAIRVSAINLPDLFSEASKAVMALSGIELQSGPIHETIIKLHAADPESLLVNWLEELIFEIEVNHRAYQGFHIVIDGDYSLQATIELVPIASISRLIKAVTFHEMAIQKVADGLETVIVFDV
jgi:SHS2 domain-containing protein